MELISDLHRGAQVFYRENEGGGRGANQVGVLGDGSSRVREMKNYKVLLKV